MIAVLTERTLDRVLSDGGTAAWTLNRSVARRHRYVVCVRSAPFTSKSEDAPPHGSAFLIGRIQDIVTAPENSKKWLIRFSSISPILFHNSWKKWRNPVKYTSLEELGITGSHKFFSVRSLRARNNLIKSNQSVPSKSVPSKQETSFNDIQIQKNAIEDAKSKLANVFGVSVDAIEINIKL
ncbi:hypothetical protein [Methylobacterium variabile]|uniref:hypothetical protein n=1 Tax=Methylobacterium variabile TaxID=298794 RepID=UPI0012EE2531|nr:hypothetical protein [Methylobacterium variabile]